MQTTIVNEDRQIPNLNLKNLIPRKSPPKSSVRSTSSNKYEEDVISNRSAFSHRSSSSRLRALKKVQSSLPPIPPSQDVSETDISKVFDQMMDEISEQQENINPEGISIEKSFGS